jgi:hypothetical protein
MSFKGILTCDSDSDTADSAIKAMRPSLGSTGAGC